MLRNWVEGVNTFLELHGLGCGGLITFLAIEYMLSAAQMVSGGDWDDNVPCTCAHVECYATGPCIISPKQPD